MTQEIFARHVAFHIRYLRGLRERVIACEVFTITSEQRSYTDMMNRDTSAAKSER